MKISLETYIQRSKKAVAANRAKGNRHAELFSQMYVQKERFLDEIIQNTEDAYRMKDSLSETACIRFSLFYNRLEIVHSGKAFDVEDLMSVTSFANTTKKKKDKKDLIGRFGIGFKSVYAITDFPEIHSGGFHFRICEYEVLESCALKSELTEGETCIVLPFKKNRESELYSLVERGLKQLNYGHLLFLKKIEKIEINGCEDQVIIIEKITRRISNSVYHKKVVLSNTKDSNLDKTNEFLVIKDVKDDAVNIAFKVLSDENAFRYVPETDAPLFVYFPILFRTGLNFLIHAPFKTNPLRESVSFADSAENTDLLKKAILLFGQSVKVLQKCGVYDVSFLSSMLVNAEVSETADVVKKSILELYFSTFVLLLKESKCIPCYGKFVSAENLVLPAESAISELLDRKDVQVLFQKENLAGKEFAGDEMLALRKFMEQRLNVKIVDTETLAFRLKISMDFLEKKPVKWLHYFYSFLDRHEELWDKQHELFYFSLRNFPFVLTTSKKMVAPYDENGNLQIFISTVNFSFLHTLNPTITDNYKGLWTKLGLRAPEAIDEMIYQAVPELISFAETKPVQYYKAIEKLYIFYQKADKDSAFRLAKLISEKPVIRAVNDTTSFSGLVPRMCHLNNTIANLTSVTEEALWFVDPVLLRKLKKIDSSGLLPFLKDIGIIFHSNTGNEFPDDESFEPTVTQWIPVFSPEDAFTNYKINESIAVSGRMDSSFVGILQQSGTIPAFLNNTEDEISYTENAYHEMEHWAGSFLYLWLKTKFEIPDDTVLKTSSGYFEIKHSELEVDRVFVCFKTHEMKEYFITPGSLKYMITYKEERSRDWIILLDGCGSSAILLNFFLSWSEFLSKFDFAIKSRVLLKKADNF